MRPDVLGIVRSVSMNYAVKMLLARSSHNVWYRTKSIKTGDKHRTNRMFRRRIYAQGFTILAMFAGSIYWEGDRKKRTEYNELVEDKKKRERHEAWLKELEIREEEEQELRRRRDKMIEGRMAERQRGDHDASQQPGSRLKEAEKQNRGGWNSVRSVLESSESRRQKPILRAAVELWVGRR